MSEQFNTPWNIHVIRLAYAIRDGSQDIIAKIPIADGSSLGKAHLIAAAPDGYALAEWIERHWSNQDMNHADFRTQAAIMALGFLAKARGDQP